MATRPIDRITQLLDTVTGRAFVTGPAVVDPSDTWFGHDVEQFTPEEYGEYIATSAHVYSCAKLRATLLSGLRLRLYRGLDTDRNEVTSGPLHELLHKVNPYWTMSRLLEMTELSLCLWGSCYWFLERGGGRGKPKEIWWARPDRVSVVPDPKNYVKEFVYRSFNGGQEIRYSPDEVIWFRYANPLDQFSGLSPLAAARLSADSASAAMKSNRNIFANGSNMSGVITPATDGNTKDKLMSADQARELTQIVNERLRGTANAHRVAVLRFDAKFQPISFSPKDAEFLGLMNWTLEDVCRVYGVPIDLVGGRRTYENQESAQRALWTHTLLPEARFIEAELTEQLLPMFGLNSADMVEFDTDGIHALKEGETAEWERWESQIRIGARVINEWREEQGLEPVEWGDVWWGNQANMPISDGSMPGQIAAQQAGPQAANAAAPNPVEAKVVETVDELLIGPGSEREIKQIEAHARSVAQRIATAKKITYGSHAHQEVWDQMMRLIEPHEITIYRTVVDLFRRQRQSYLTKIKRGERPSAAALRVDGTRAADSFFDEARWNRQGRAELKPVITNLVRDIGQQSLDQIGTGTTFDSTTPEILRFLEGRTQRFVEQINDTTWKRLKKSLGEGIKAGEDEDRLAERVDKIMGERIRSNAATIARTETMGAYNGGQLAAWNQSGHVETKQWIAALDERTRDSHTAAHGQEVPLDEDF